MHNNASNNAPSRSNELHQRSCQRLKRNHTLKKIVSCRNELISLGHGPYQPWHHHELCYVLERILLKKMFDESRSWLRFSAFDFPLLASMPPLKYIIAARRISCCFSLKTCVESLKRQGLALPVIMYSSLPGTSMPHARLKYASLSGHFWWETYL